MSFSKVSAIIGVTAALASTVAAHGIVTGIVADGKYYVGYDPDYQYLEEQPVVVAWSVPEDHETGFIAPDAYQDPNIICHLDATNAKTSAIVAAGGTVELQWNEWDVSHHGPVIDYLASCANDDCTTVDKTTLEFFKIDGVGLLDDETLPGNWATDTLISKNISWTVTIPSDIAPGNYVLRHEIIALHSADRQDGAQNYPQCVNLQITGSGTAKPKGTLGTALYSPTDPGVDVNIYLPLESYVVPGPALYTGSGKEVVDAASSMVASATNVVSSVLAPVFATDAASSILASVLPTDFPSAVLAPVFATNFASSVLAPVFATNFASSGLAPVFPTDAVSSILASVLPTDFPSAVLAPVFATNFASSALAPVFATNFASSVLAPVFPTDAASSVLAPVFPTDAASSEFAPAFASAIQQASSLLAPVFAPAITGFPLLSRSTGDHVGSRRPTATHRFQPFRNGSARDTGRPFTRTKTRTRIFSPTTLNSAAFETSSVMKLVTLTVVPTPAAGYSAYDVEEVEAASNSTIAFSSSTPIATPIATPISPPATIVTTAAGKTVTTPAAIVTTAAGKAETTPAATKTAAAPAATSSAPGGSLIGVPTDGNFNNLFNWFSTFFKGSGGKSFAGLNLARREHARQVVRQV